MALSTIPSKGILHIDSAYTLAEARIMGNLRFLLARNASGLFGRVWSVHPAADAKERGTGPIAIHKIARGHALIEGSARLFRLPRLLAPLDLLLSQWTLYRLLVRIVREQRLSVVVAVDPFLSGILGLAVARATKRPLVIRVSGNHDEIHEASGALAMPRLLPSYWLQKVVERFVFRRADLVTAINANNLEYAKASGAGRTAILPISANVDAVHRVEPNKRRGAAALLKRLDVPSGGPPLLYVGRLIGLKHPDDAVRAMAAVIARHPGTVGILAGDGEMLPRLKALASELGVADAIRFPGVLDQKALSLLIPHCILLSPSAGQMALLEGALGGAAIVAYDRDFQPEFIDDGGNGFIVPFRDWRAMADRADTLVADPQMFARLSQAARQSALDYLAPERTRAAEWAAFARVLPAT
jgi:glycosyltransferase involved in cell wall biosynthesis